MKQRGWNSTFPARREPLRKMSRKREQEEEDYSAMRRRVLERDGHRCVAHTLGYAPEVPCRGPLEVDHFVPLSHWRRGRLVEEQVWSMCQRLNRAKADDLSWAVRIGIASRTPGDLPPTEGPPADGAGEAGQEAVVVTCPGCRPGTGRRRHTWTVGCRFESEESG